MCRVGEDPDLTWTEENHGIVEKQLQTVSSLGLFSELICISRIPTTQCSVLSLGTNSSEIQESSPPQIPQTSRRNKREVLRLKKKSTVIRSANNRALELGGKKGINEDLGSAL